MIFPFSDPETVDTVVAGSAFTPPFSNPASVNTDGSAGVPVPLPPFSDPATVTTIQHTEWQLPVTGSTVGANMTGPT